MENAMSRDEKDESPHWRIEPKQPLTKPNDTEGEAMNPVPGQPPDADRAPTERPDLLWNEHED